MAKGRDARDLARGIARAGWLQCSNRKKNEEKKRGGEKKKEEANPYTHSRRNAALPTPTLPPTHITTKERPAHTHTHSHSYKERKNPNLHNYHLALLPHPKCTTLRLPSSSSLSFPFLSFCMVLLPFPVDAQKSFSIARAGIPSLSLSTSVFFSFCLIEEILLLAFCRVTNHVVEGAALFCFVWPIFFSCILRALLLISMCF